MDTTVEREIKKHASGTWCIVQNGRWFPFGYSEKEVKVSSDRNPGDLWESGYGAWISGTSTENCERMSESSIVPESDNAEKAAADLAAKGTYPNHEVVVACHNEIMIDYDLTDVPQRFLDVLQVLQTQRFNGSVSYRRYRSKGGNCHVVVSLPEKITDLERIAWQAAFGSDPMREALSLVSVSRKVKNPVLLYMAKDRVAVSQTYEKPGRKFRDE